MPDFKNGKIYRLYSKENDEISYIGSTTLDLSMRLCRHKSSFKRWKNGKQSDNCQSFVLFSKYNDVIIELLEKYPCENFEQLRKREQHYIDTMPHCNKQEAIKKLDPDSYYATHYDYFRQKIQCACGSRVCRDKIARHYKSKKHQKFVSTG